MPEPISATVAFVTAAYSSAVAATATVLGAMGTVGALGMGGTYALAGAIVKGGALLGLSAASAALMRPNIPSSGTTLDFKPDPKAPVRGAMGYTALGGNKVFQATWGYKRVAMSLGVALSLGPIDQVPRFEADGTTVTFSGPQNEATGFYAADMWQRTTLGLPGDAALLPPTGLKYGNPGLTGWGTQHAAPQTAFSFWTMVLAKNPEDRDVFTNGVPDPRWIGRWMKLWDPRKDSTYPGGNGPQRRDDWRTWGWSENPYVHSLAWFRGHFKLNLDGTVDRTKRIAGIGAPDAAIDIPAFVEGMNVADANAWTISGEWSTSDGKFQTALAMLQAGGGEPISRGAQISVLVNAPRVSTYTYTRDDLIGQAEIRPLTPRRERKNTIIPRYKSEANGWQYVPAGEVTSSVYRDEDRGEPRSLEIEYTHVRNAKQAGQLAAYDLANLREGLTATLPSKVHLMHVHPGACITVDVPELALAGQKFIVRRATTNHQAASVTLELRSESDGKHAWALGQAAQPAPSPSLSAVDPKYVPPPAAEDWTVLPKPPGDGGVSQPIFVIEAPVETTDIVAVIIKHGPSASGPWTDGYEGSPRADGRYEVAGLTPGQTYCVSLQYVAKNGAKSDPDIKCGIVAGDLIAGGLAPEARETIIQDIIEQVDIDVAEGLEAGREALERSKEMGRALIDAAVAALEGTLSEEKVRHTEIQDALDRLGIAIVADPIARTGLVRKEVMAEGVGPSGKETFVQMNTRLTAVDAGLGLAVAQVEIDAKAYSDGLMAAAYLTLASKAELNSAIAASELTLKSYADNKVATATAGLATKAELGSAIAASRLEIESWTNGQISTATANLITASGVDGKIAAARLSIETWTNGQISTATANLATVAQMNAAIAASELTLKSYADNKVATATANLATKAELASGLSTAELNLKSYTDGKVANAIVGLISASAVDAKIATASLTLSSEIDSKVATATANLVSAAQLSAALAGAELSLKSYTDNTVSNATALLASKAEVQTRGNMLPNSTAANGWNGWNRNANWQATSGGSWGARFETGASGTHTNTSDQISVHASTAYVLSADLLRFATSGNVVVDVRWLTSGGAEIGFSPRIFASTSRDYGERLSIAITSPANAAFAQVRFFGESLSGVTRVGVRRIKLERGALPATAWTDEATDLQFSATAAIQADAIADAATKLSQARLRLVTAAGGGNPAVVELYSDNAGASDIRLLAKQIQFGENTILDTTTGLQVSVFGTTRRVVAQGAAFGASPDAGQLTEWEGPNNIAMGAMTRANAYYYRANTDPRHGGSAVNGSAPFSAKADFTGVAGGRAGAGNVQTNLITITVQNPKGPVTYQWYKLSGDDLSITAPNAAATRFSGTVGALQSKSAAFACLVTDTGSGASATILATAIILDNSPI